MCASLLWMYLLHHKNNAIKSREKKNKYYRQQQQQQQSVWQLIKHHTFSYGFQSLWHSDENFMSIFLCVWLLKSFNAWNACWYLTLLFCCTFYSLLLLLFLFCFFVLFFFVILFSLFYFILSNYLIHSWIRFFKFIQFLNN